MFYCGAFITWISTCSWAFQRGSLGPAGTCHDKQPRPLRARATSRAWSPGELIRKVHEPLAREAGAAAGPGPFTGAAASQRKQCRHLRLDAPQEGSLGGGDPHQEDSSAGQAGGVLGEGPGPLCLGPEWTAPRSLRCWEIGGWAEGSLCWGSEGSEGSGGGLGHWQETPRRTGGRRRSRPQQGLEVGGFPTDLTGRGCTETGCGLGPGLRRSGHANSSSSNSIQRTYRGLKIAACMQLGPITYKIQKGQKPNCLFEELSKNGSFVGSLHTAPARGRAT